ncbi:uncharacterized protein LOC143082555 [Mytilus galloprovincialis]|uniref:uncharacterized protein LOC143082555 n=1 Tax=Mytilus galloprovincialis TaxID=29158 RepID=UPI003F7C92BE
MECVWPPPPSHIVLFIAYLSLKGRAHKTVSCYVTAIGFRCKVLQSQFMDYSQNFIIRKMLEGLKRSKFSKDKRLPITSELLTRIIEKLPSVCYSAYESLLFAAAFSVAFHGFLRVGELVYTKLGQAQNIISIHGTQILWGAKGEFIRLHLTHSKGDQTGKGISIDIRKTDSTVCPILLLKRYLRVRPIKNVPLLCHLGGKCVSRYQFSGILSKALNVIGIDSSGYKSHSFRIGAASEASAKRISNEEIMKLGRWKSGAYRSYIRL